MAEYDVNPNVYNFGDPIGGFMQGYQAAYIPKQMQQQQQQAAQQQQMNAMKQRMMQQQMQSAPQEQAAKMQQMQLQNKGLGLSNQIDAQKLQAAKMDQQRRAVFMQMMQGGSGSSSGSQSTNPSAATTAGMPMPNQGSPVAPQINYNTPYGQRSPNPMAMNGGLAPGQAPSQAIPAQIPAQQAPRPMQGQAPMGNPAGQPQQQVQPSSMDQLDQMYLNPQTRGQFGDLWKEYAPNAKQQIINDPQTGQAFVATTLPSGRVDFKAQQIGPTAEQTAFSKERGKGDATLYNQALSQNNQLIQNSAAIDGLLNQVQTDPDMQNIIGPKGESLVTQYFGTPEQKQKLGEFRANSGIIFTDLMKSMTGTGSISDKEGAQFLKMKPNTSDSPDVVLGKIKGSKAASEFAKQRNSAFLNNMDQGMNSSQALKLAEKQVPFDQVQAQVNQIINPPITLYKNGVPHSVPKNEVSPEMMKKWGYSYERQ